MKPFKYEIQKKKWDKLRRRKLITGIAIGGCSALVFAGAGVGVGYIIFSKKQTATPSLEATTSKLTLSGPGDETTFNISWSNFKIKDNIVIYIERDESIAQYFEQGDDGQSMLSIETSSGWGVSNDSYVFPITSTKGTTSIKIKQNKQSSESQMETILPFKVSAVGWTWSDSIIRELSCCLINPLASSLIDPSEVRNKTIRTTDISSTTYSLANLIQYLPNTFQQLPSSTNKITFASNANDSDVLRTLHIYDNAESFAALLVTDMYLCSNDTYYGEDGINIFHVGSNIKDNPNDQAKFDTTIQQFGKLGGGEINNDIFVASQQNFSDSWEITWALWIKYHGAVTPYWETQSNVSGMATGLSNSAWQSGVRSALKVIYGGVVSTWPESWR